METGRLFALCRMIDYSGFIGYCAKPNVPEALIDEGLLRAVSAGGELYKQNVHKFKFWGCTGITCLPELLGLKELEIVEFVGCTELVDARELSKLSELTRVNFSGCTKLKHLPIFSLLNKIEYLDLSGCKKLKQLPDLRGCRFLRQLDLSGTRFVRRISESLVNNAAISGNRDSVIALLEAIRDMNCVKTHKRTRDSIDTEFDVKEEMENVREPKRAKHISE